MEDLLINTSPYSQLILAAAVYTVGGYLADRGGGKKERDGEMSIQEAEAWLNGREEEYENPWEALYEEEGNEEEEMSYEEAKRLMEEE